MKPETDGLSIQTKAFVGITASLGVVVLGYVSVALAVARLDAICLLPGGGRAGLGTEGATARHRRHDVGELPVHPAGRSGVEPS